MSKQFQGANEWHPQGKDLGKFHLPLLLWRFAVIISRGFLMHCPIFYKERNRALWMDREGTDRTKIFTK